MRYGVYAFNIKRATTNQTAYSLRFGVESVEKMVGWALETVPPNAGASILEIGSGNGTLLFALVEAGYTARNLAGIDYSADAVKLAKSIAATKGGEGIVFSVCDFLEDDPPLLLRMEAEQQLHWNLLLDKGTYDAIALGEKDENGRSPTAGYPEHVAKLLAPGGYFLITCMFTFVVILRLAGTEIEQLVISRRTS